MGNQQPSFDEMKGFFMILRKLLTENELGIITNTRYYIYSNGMVFSEFSNKFLVEEVTKIGYIRIYIQGRHFLLHRLVAKAFIPNPNNLPVVNHKDTDVTNNCMDNLEWCPVEQNVNYKPTYDKRVNSIKKGEDCNFSKLTKKDVIEIVDYLNEGIPCDEIAFMFNVIPKSIRNIRNGSTWRSVTGFVKKGSTVIHGGGEAIE